MSHVNGGGFDFVNATTSGKNEKNRKMMEAMVEFGCLKFNVGNNAVFKDLQKKINEDVTIKSDGNHNNHLHCGPVNEIKTMKIQQDK